MARQKMPHPTDSLVLVPAYDIGASELRCCLASLRDRGLLHRVLLIAPPDLLAPSELEGVLYVLDDFSDWKSLPARIEALAPRHPIEGIAGIDEELHFAMSHHLARHFALPFHDDRTRFVASNKYLAKQAFVEAGVPTSPFTLISEVDERAPQAVGFPNVLKVMSGTQSQYLFLNESMEALRANHKRMVDGVGRITRDPRFDTQRVVVDGEVHELDPTRQFLLEGFVPGQEYSCDFKVHAGEIRVIRVTKKLASPSLGIFTGYLLLGSDMLGGEGIEASALEDVCRKLARAMGTRDAVCMVDFKVGARGITVLESSVRPGFSAFNHLMYELFGYTSFALMVMAAMGESVTLTQPAATGAVVYFLAPSTGGGRVNTRGLEARAKELGITAIHRYTESGEATEVDPTPRLRGYAVVQGFDLRELETLMATIQQEVTYEEGT